VRVCFVCSGNICRSPTAEVVLIELLRASGREDVDVDSAGTGGWHAGEDMDPRSRATLVANGYTPPRHIARQFVAADFAERDLVIALDSGHHRYLTELARDADDPDTARARIVMLRGYDATAEALDVGDPYYGGADGFTEVLRQIERGCVGLLPILDSDVIGNDYR
jgi:protein-tyrosine phosphatase